MCTKKRHFGWVFLDFSHIEQKTKTRYDHHIKTKLKLDLPPIKLNQIVYIKTQGWVGTQRKLRPKYRGPYKVIEIKNSDSYIIAPFDHNKNKYDTTKATKQHLRHLKVVR